MEYLFLILWFIILIYSSDILVDWASSVAKKIWISNLMIGLTVVALGSSAPEFFINIIWAIEWKTDLAVWNILGSIIVNSLLVLWASAVIYPLKAKNSIVNREVPFLILWIFALLIISYDSFISSLWVEEITRWEWILLLMFFVLYVAYLIANSKNSGEENEISDIKEMSGVKSWFYVVFWLAWLVIWWKLLVEWATKIAQNFWLTETLIGLTVVAIWTSLPELAVSAMAAYKKNADIAIWNVVGSNIYWVFLILWASSTISNIKIDEFIKQDIFIAFALNIILWFFLFFYWGKWKITRIEWFIMCILYIAYIIFLIQTRV